ncbi:hypothetical protein H8E50_00095 [bacterium]|nr:hypothetical protein [bacterium]
MIAPRKYAFILSIDKTSIIQVKGMKDVRLQPDHDGTISIVGYREEGDTVFIAKGLMPGKAKIVLSKILEQLNDVHAITIKRWLKFSEAIMYASMSKNYLRGRIEEGKIYAIQRDDGDWIVDRYSIDALYERDKKEAMLRAAG